MAEFAGWAAALEIFGRSVGDRVHEQVETAAERLAHLPEDTSDVFVGADVALGHERARDGVRELANTLLDSLSLVGERELGARIG